MRVQSSPLLPYRDLAQLGEHLSYKQKVSSSTLLISTIYGAIGEMINTPDCDSGIHRFDSYIAPQEYKIVLKTIYKCGIAVLKYALVV